MPSVLELHLSALTNGMSLGGAASEEQLSDVPINNLFDDVLPAESSAGGIEYRAVDILNSGDDEAHNVTIYCSGTPSPGTDALFGLEDSPIDSVTSIPNETTAPPITGSFAAYTVDSRLICPVIPAGSYVRLWVARTVLEGTINMVNDGLTFVWEHA